MSIKSIKSSIEFDIALVEEYLELSEAVSKLDKRKKATGEAIRQRLESARVSSIEVPRHGKMSLIPEERVTYDKVKIELLIELGMLDREVIDQAKSITAFTKLDVRRKED